MISITDFGYHLPKNKIASKPAHPRDSSKLMLVNRSDNSIRHAVFHDIGNILTPNDVLVLNQTKVFPARIYGKKRVGEDTEILLIKPTGADEWECLGKNLKIGTQIDFSNNITGTIKDKHPDSGTATIKFSTPTDYSLQDLIEDQGHTPIPPYIQSSLTEIELRQKYQTVYAKEKGSVAAPTAGLHFTKGLLNNLAQKGIQIETVTLHVGPGTFGTLYPHHIENKKLHAEKYDAEADTIRRLFEAKRNGKRIIAVGTTSCRSLETIFTPPLEIVEGALAKASGSTELFIMPAHQFHFVDALITNFHLPESSLLMLVTAFVSAPNTKHPYTTFKDSLMGSAYQSAIENDYRFFSFGDAMFIQ